MAMENSEVSPAASVAVPVIHSAALMVADKVTLKLTVPLAFVVTVAEPR